MKRVSLIIIGTFLFSSIGLSEEKAEEKSKQEKLDDGFSKSFAKQSNKELLIPNQLIKKIEEDYRAFLKTAKKEEGSEKAEKGVNRKLIIARIELTQEKRAALKNNTRIITPPGGGTIDLEDVVTPLKGSFHLSVKMEDDRHIDQTVHRVYFISQTKKRTIEKEEYGAGCGKFFDITSYYASTVRSPGATLYTADQRYVSVLGGTFVFVSHTAEALQLASLTFMDSRFTKWSCTQSEVL